MPNRNKILFCAAALALLGAPALADGKRQVPTVQAPAPLKPHSDLCGGPDGKPCGERVIRRVERPTPVVRQAAAQPFKYDFNGFGGGVGANIDGGGFYGGRGVFVVNSAPRFSGVVDAPGAVFTFTKHVTPGDTPYTPPTSPPPACNVCG